MTSEALNLKVQMLLVREGKRFKIDNMFDMSHTCGIYVNDCYLQIVATSCAHSRHHYLFYHFLLIDP